MARVEVAPGMILDGRLALFHEEDGWLAVADTHYGYSEVMRARGGLFPLWGNQTVAARLEELSREYRPSTLVVVGDLVHGRVGRELFAGFLRHLEELAPELVLIRGNHDRSPTAERAGFVESWRRGAFFFHHGHLNLAPPPGTIEILGHWHPAISWSDGAGTSLKLPALVGEEGRWILPAFSPWAGGKSWPPAAATRRWICSPHRVFEFVEESGRRALEG